VKLTMTHIPRPDGTFYDSACSAALISPSWIITAGHCFHDVNRNPVSGPGFRRADNYFVLPRGHCCQRS